MLKAFTMFLKAYLVLFALVTILGGCAAMGTMMQGMGNGLQNASRQPVATYQYQRPVSCSSYINSYGPTMAGGTTTCY